MAYNVGDSFNRTTNQPPFIGMVFADEAARDAYTVGLRYEGMTVYCIAEQTYYSLVGGTSNADWVEGAGGGGGILTVADYGDMLAIDPADRYDGLIVYVIDLQENWQLRGGIDDTDFRSLDELNLPVVSATQDVFEGTAFARTGGRVERVNLQGASGEPEGTVNVTIPALPTPFDGDQLFVQGTSNTRPVNVADKFTVAQNEIGHLMYDQFSGQWIKVGGV